MEHEAKKSPPWWNDTPQTACVWSVNVATQLACREIRFSPKQVGITRDNLSTACTRCKSINFDESTLHRHPLVASQ